MAKKLDIPIPEISARSPEVELRVFALLCSAMPCLAQRVLSSVTKCQKIIFNYFLMGSRWVSHRKKSK